MLGDRTVRASLRHKAEHLTLAFGELVEGAALALAGDEARHDRRIDHAFAFVDPAERVRDDGNLRDPVLQEVSGALGGLLQQTGCVARVQIMRQDEDAGIRVAAADLLRRDEPVVALIRGDRKSTRLNSSHLVISYAVFCLKKKNTQELCDCGPIIELGAKRLNE